MCGYLKPSQVEFVQDLFVERFYRGDDFLRETAYRLNGNLLNNKRPELASFTNYYDYLNYLYQQTPHSVKPKLISLGERERDLLNIYSQIFDSRVKRKKEKPGRLLKKDQVFIETAYFPDSRKVALARVRVKDVDRAINKIAYRLIQAKNESKKCNRNSSRVVQEENPSINDWFGISIVTYRSNQVHLLFNQIYPNLEKYGLIADKHREPAITKEGINMGKQEPGVDNHFLFGPGKRDHLIQIKAQRTDGFKGHVEIVLTDYAHLLVDEMDHLRFRARQNNTLVPQNAREKREFKKYVKRGKELTAKLPKNKRKVLVPKEFF